MANFNAPGQVVIAGTVEAVARAGEAVIRKGRGRKFAYGLKLQLLESNRIDETLNQRLASGNVIRMGVEFDGAGRAVLGVGGGITAASDPAAEWQECLDKAASIVGQPRVRSTAS